MVLVNTPGDGAHSFGPLQHADWHGWTPTDAVFPSFVWIIGLAITLSLGKRLAEGKSLSSPRSFLLGPIFRRAVILFFLGVLLYATPHFDLATFRILGVLQRLAICYLAASAIFLYTGWRGQMVWCAGLLAVYTGLMLGFGDWTIEGNFAHTVDRVVLGAHNYVNRKTWDPEGIVSTLTSISSCLLGVLAGHLLRAKKPLMQRITLMAFLGAALLGSGLLLDGVIPINKSIWTPSFVLLMAGIDFLLFALILWVCDVWKLRRGTEPWVIFGRNSIAVYLFSEFLIIPLDEFGWRAGIYKSVFQPLGSPEVASLLFALAYTGLCFGFAWVLHRRGLYLRV